MKSFHNLTPLLEAIQRNHERGYTVFTSFVIGEDKMREKSEDVICNFGTGLPTWKQQDRKHKKLPIARAVCGPVSAQPGKWEVIIQATPLACTAPLLSPFAHEKWRDQLPKFGDYELTHEVDNRGNYTWTWKLQEHIYWQLSRHLTAIVKRRGAAAVAAETKRWAKVFPMFGGVRRQLQRLLKSAMKLWVASCKETWPGLLPAELPMKIGFRGTGDQA